MLSKATVISVRAWEPSTLSEIVIHTPTIAMEKWDSIKRFKCKVGEWDYRDYTPAKWDAETRQCTLYIETGHAGAGSHWARQLRAGDEIRLGPAHAASLPGKPGKILCLGDSSALGHFLSLRQLTNARQYPMEGCVLRHDYCPSSQEFLPQHPYLEWITSSSDNAVTTLEEWLQAKDISAFSSIYIAGNIPMVQGLRRKLKALPTMRAHLYAHGFWS